MATKKSYSTLKTATATVNSMLNNGFGVVTVCNARIYDFDADAFVSDDHASGVAKVNEIIDYYEGGTTKYEKCLVYLKTLKTATSSTDGPNKTVTGGQYANTLIKYGKTARLEIQDALGTSAGLATMTGAVIEDFAQTSTVASDYTLDGDLNTGVVHFGSNFAGPKTIIGDTFFIDQKTGAQVKLRIIFYQVNPDSTFTLTQDAEGDATVFDMNGDLLTTDILVGTNGQASGDVVQGMFYSVVPAEWMTDDVTGEKSADSEVLIDETIVEPEFVIESNAIKSVPVGSVVITQTDSSAVVTVYEPSDAVGKPVTAGDTLVAYLKNGTTVTKTIA